MPRCFRIILRFVLVSGIAIATPGCAAFKKRRSERAARKAEEVARAKAAEPVAPHRIGTITLVNEHDRFVLIDTAMAPTPAVGTALKAFTGEAESAVLAVGNVARRPFVVADIVKGEPQKGDAVYQ